MLSPDNPSDNLEDAHSPAVYDPSFEEICFLPNSQNYCVCFVDMVDSTGITAKLSDHQKIRQYYSIFINTMAALLRNYGGKVVKNAGDALIFYFPDSSDAANEAAFEDMLECFIVMVLARDIINAKLDAQNLLPVSYRISADYGRVEVATSTSSRTEDLFGSPMNICAKINSMAEPNGIVIGGDLYQIIKSFSFVNNDGYEFSEVRGGCSLSLNCRYPVYRVLSKNFNNNNRSIIDINSINHLFAYKQTSKINDVQSKQHQISQQMQQSEHQEPLRKHPVNIMVVDDEEDTLFTYESFLSDEGYNVKSFTDSLEALKDFVQLPDPSSHYNLAILDIRMPKLNGLQLFYKMKKLSPKIKILFCSALEIAEELTSVLPDIERKHIIKKPVEREYLINKIYSALNER
ncbi:MAG: response regulator [Nitrososphaeraceae archaeon]|nr:response regulator [Nitrososphaeraceae archaeon]